jgi:hypothetical protein
MVPVNDPPGTSCVVEKLVPDALGLLIVMLVPPDSHDQLYE